MVPHRRLRIRTAAWWLLYPVAYCAFTTVRGVVSPGSAYPYGFIDVSELGYGGLLLNVVVYGIGFFVLGPGRWSASTGVLPARRDRRASATRARRREHDEHGPAPAK